jgi:hypothetical protein
MSKEDIKPVLKLQRTLSAAKYWSRQVGLQFYPIALDKGR